MTTNSKNNNIQSLLASAKDEIVDIFDSIAFAETNEERLGNIVDIVHRHKLIISAGVLIGAAKYTFAGKRGAQIGKDMIKELRQQEIQRWGKRSAGL
jgi:hypothetical protein